MNFKKDSVNTSFSSDQIDKLGNAIIYLSEKVNYPYKTKLLKLIFLLEEESIKRYGHPFFNIRFDVWRLGPVSKELFIEFSEEPILLQEYIQLSPTTEGTVIKGKKSFSDDEFNDLEIELLEEISYKYRDSVANDLVELTHQEGSLWKITAEKFGVYEALEKCKINSTDHMIDFSILLSKDNKMQERYYETLDFLSITKK
jgi:uncharacterized phage-associated protein